MSDSDIEVISVSVAKPCPPRREWGPGTTVGYIFTELANPVTGKIEFSSLKRKLIEKQISIENDQISNMMKLVTERHEDGGIGFEQFSEFIQELGF
jgi:hypothetical protein